MARREGTLRNMGDPVERPGVGRVHSTEETCESRRREGARGQPDAFYVAERKEIGVSLRTPGKLRKLQRKLYTKANQEPEFRFYSLIDKVCWRQTLRHAWRLVRENGGSPGVDGVSIERIEEMGVEEWLEEIEQELDDGTYRAEPVLRVKIPKPTGGHRNLGIPTVKDRVVQTATKLVIEPIFEADLEEEAYGYRPERSAKDAIEQVHRELMAGRCEVVDADLSSYFDTIPHDQLMKSVRRRISDGRILELIKMWLEAPIVEEDDEGGQRSHPNPGQGTPQGGVISPLLANVYINRFLKFWKHQKLDQRLDSKIVNYADDFVILTRGHAEEALEVTRKAIEAMGLKLNEQKTCLTNVNREPLEFLGYAFGWDYYKPTGRRYLSARPAPSRVSRLKQKVKAWFKRNIHSRWEFVTHRLNQMLRGWANYFSYGSITKAYRKMDKYVYERAVATLVRKHGCEGRGKGRWSNGVLYSQGGLKRLHDLKPTSRR